MEILVYEGSEKTNPIFRPGSRRDKANFKYPPLKGAGKKGMPHDLSMIAVVLIGNDARFRPRIAEDSKPIFRNLLAVTEILSLGLLAVNLA